MALTALYSAARAQMLDRLSVGTFRLTADPTRLHVGETMRLIMRIHVDQRIAELNNVTLPDLSGFDVLGDERTCVAARKGTDCSETITLSPNVAGVRTLAPVTLDAVDVHNRKASRFATNSVTVTVLPGAPTTAPLVPGAVSSVLSGVLRTLLTLALAVLAILAVVWGFGRARHVRAPAMPVAPLPRPVAPPPSPVPDRETRLRAAIERLRADPSRAGALEVRTLLRERAGAREEETLEDLAGRGLRDSALFEALTGIERASFVEEARVSDAARAALPSLDAVLVSPTPASDHLP